jgi:hypothetical protein
VMKRVQEESALSFWLYAIHILRDPTLHT